MENQKHFIEVSTQNNQSTGFVDFAQNNPETVLTIVGLIGGILAAAVKWHSASVRRDVEISSKLDDIKGDSAQIKSSMSRVNDELEKLDDKMAEQVLDQTKLAGKIEDLQVAEEIQDDRIHELELLSKHFVEAIISLYAIAFKYGFADWFPEFFKPQILQRFDKEGIGDNELLRQDLGKKRRETLTKLKKPKKSFWSKFKDLFE